MFEDFNHYVSYGSSDQQTMTNLRELYDGLVVPATIAAMQGQATGGFVLAMTALDQDLPYVIDSRFPLFQRRLEAPKPSHVKLAEILDDERLILTEEDPTPESFDAPRIQKLATNWNEFNSSYEDTHKEKFDKYAERLGEALDPQDAQDPDRILPLYFIVTGPGEPWWDQSEALWQATRALAPNNATRVIAVENSSFLARSLEAVTEEEIAIWASGLNEMDSISGDLFEYGVAVAEAGERGQKLFALYGGYFHVMLMKLGLTGFSHGIGFGEHRDWTALSSSGGPPPRFYLPRAHRYFPQDLAQVLWEQDPEIISCPCGECENRSPGGLSYHALMRHSVRVRDLEITHARERSLRQLHQDLIDDQQFLVERISKLSLTSKMRTRVNDLLDHFDSWITAVGSLVEKYPEA